MEFDWNITMEFSFGSIFRITIVYLLVLFFSSFITILSLMSKGSLHSFSFVTVNTLQVNALVYVTSSFPLLRLLLFGINACHKCVTYLGFVHNDLRYRWKLDSSNGMTIFRGNGRWIMHAVTLAENFIHFVHSFFTFIVFNHGPLSNF